MPLEQVMFDIEANKLQKQKDFYLKLISSLSLLTFIILSFYSDVYSNKYVLYASPITFIICWLFYRFTLVKNIEDDYYLNRCVAELLRIHYYAGEDFNILDALDFNMKHKLVKVLEELNKVKLVSYSSNAEEFILNQYEYHINNIIKLNKKRNNLIYTYKFLILLGLTCILSICLFSVNENLVFFLADLFLAGGTLLSIYADKTQIECSIDQSKQMSLILLNPDENLMSNCVRTVAYWYMQNIDNKIEINL